MTIGQTWTNPNTIELAVGDDLPAATWNAMLANINAAGGVLFLGTNALGLLSGSPTIGASGAWSWWSMDAASDEMVSGIFLIPPGWVTANIIYWWSNDGAGSGDVRWDAFYELDGDAGTMSAGTTTSLTITAPAVGVLKKSTMVSGLSVTAGSLLAIGVNRDANHVADTLANDARLLGVELRRAT